jgi:hypothetical protein
MSRFVSVMKMHVTGKNSQFNWFYLPWLIVFASFFINLFLALISKAEIYTGGIGFVFIYMFIAAMLTLNNTFPFVIGFNVRRKDYFLGTLLLFGAISASFTLILYLFTFIESQLIKGWGVNLHFFSLPYLNEGSVFEQLAIYFLGMLFMVLTGFAQYSIYTRYKAPGTYIYVTVALLLITIAWFAFTYFGWLEAIFRWINQQSAFQLALWTLPISAICILASYLLLRRATI